MSTSERWQNDPAVVPLVDNFEVSMDAWLESVRCDEPLALSVPTAELLAHARAESA